MSIGHVSRNSPVVACVARHNGRRCGQWRHVGPVLGVGWGRLAHFTDRRLHERRLQVARTVHRARDLRSKQRAVRFKSVALRKEQKY